MRWPSDRTRQLGAMLAGVNAVIIGILTLSPASVPLPPSGPWCLVCGEQGTVDVLQNLLLFLPLGFGLALAARPVRQVLALCFAFSVAIEGSQFVWIAGRAASVGDVLANTLGGWLGWWAAGIAPYAIWPSVGRARVLWASSLVAYLAIVLGVFASLQPTLSGPPIAIEWAPRSHTRVPYEGRVLSVRLNGTNTPDGLLPNGAEIIGQLLARKSTWEIEVLPGPPTRGPAPIASFMQDDREAATMEQDGRDLICTRRLRGSTLRLRTPSVVLRNVFPTREKLAAERAHMYRLNCNLREGALVVVRSTMADVASSEAPLTVGMGSLLFLPLPYAARELPITLARLHWLVVLLVPVGYWGARAASGVGSQARALGRIAIVTLTATVLATSLALLPELFRFARTPRSEWAAASLGAAAGIVLALAVKSREASGRLPPV